MRKPSMKRSEGMKESEVRATEGWGMGFRGYMNMTICEISLMKISLLNLFQLENMFLSILNIVKTKIYF